MHRYLLPYAVTVCVCCGTILRKVNTMISSPYLNCKTESPAQPNEDWKRQNVLQSLNCGLVLQDILFSREHLLFSVVSKSLPSFYYLSPGNGFEHQCFLLTILIMNVLNDFPKIQSGLYTYPYHTLQKVTRYMPYKSVLYLRGDSLFSQQQKAATALSTEVKCYVTTAFMPA